MSIYFISDLPLYYAHKYTKKIANLLKIVDPDNFRLKEMNYKNTINP